MTSLFFRSKEEEINAILLKPSVDLNALKAISRTRGGFVSNRMRTRVWPKLLNVNRYLIDDYRSYIDPHRDDTQVSCDVERSLWNFNHISAWKDSFRDKRRKALSNIIMAVLCRNEHLFYYQGFHDIVSIFLLVLEEDHLTFALVESTAQLYLSDYMQKDFEIVSKSMRMILVLVASVDPELANYLKAAKLEPYFATSWLITWFAHDIKSIDDIARIYDVFLCSHPLFSYYVCAAYVIHLRKQIFACECDFAALHNLLVHAPTTFGFPFEKILPSADEMFEKIPINKLKTLCDGELLKLIVNNQIICLSRPHWVMHKSRRVDSDLTLLQRLKIGNPANSSGRFPIFRYYVNSVLASWGWKQSDLNQSTKFLTRGDSSDDLSSSKSKEGGLLNLNSLFLSIAVLVGGILAYAIITEAPVPPASI